jgi:hypothetical protein
VPAFTRTRARTRARPSINTGTSGTKDANGEALHAMVRFRRETDCATTGILRAVKQDITGWLHARHQLVLVLSGLAKRQCVAGAVGADPGRS